CRSSALFTTAGDHTLSGLTVSGSVGRPPFLTSGSTFRGGAVEESLLPQSTQPAASAVTSSDIDTSSADPVTTSTDPLPGSASTRASTTVTPPVSSDPDQQLPSVTEGESSPSDDDDPDRFVAVPRQHDP